MPTKRPDRARTRWKSRLTLILGVGAGAVAPAPGGDGPPANYPVQPKPRPKGIKGLLSHREATTGTLGYGPPGPQPGFQGFGLRFGLNYGYGGGNALGVGADGGYPIYGGPGYPHPWPELRRIGGITAFPYYGGPGGPTPTCPNFYGQPGTLAVDEEVVKFEDSPEAPETDFGAYTGLVPYPEKTFAPFSNEGERAVKDPVSDSISVSPLPPPPPPSDVPAGSPGGAADATVPGNAIGAEVQPVADASARGMKVTRVYPGQAAARSGLAAGDVIRSANGYATEQPGNLEWIIAHAAPDRTLKLSIRAARDGEVRVVSTQLR